MSLCGGVIASSSRNDPEQWGKGRALKDRGEWKKLVWRSDMAGTVSGDQELERKQPGVSCGAKLTGSPGLKSSLFLVSAGL